MTQSHAALYKIINEVVGGWWHQITKHVGLRECEVMDDTWYVCQVGPYYCTNLAVHSFSTPLAMNSFLHAKSRIYATFLCSSTSSNPVTTFFIFSINSPSLCSMPYILSESASHPPPLHCHILYTSSPPSSNLSISPPPPAALLYPPLASSVFFSSSFS